MRLAEEASGVAAVVSEVHGVTRPGRAGGRREWPGSGVAFEVSGPHGAGSVGLVGEFEFTDAGDRQAQRLSTFADQQFTGGDLGDDREAAVVFGIEEVLVGC